MSSITRAAQKYWLDSESVLPFAEWLEQQKQSGRFWGA